jgi:hypothetical protein
MTFTRAEISARHYAKHKEKINAKAKEARENGLYKERLDKYKEEHKEEVIEKRKNKYLENRDEVLKQQKEKYYANHEKSLIKNRISYHKNKVLKTEEEKAETKRIFQEKVKQRREENKPNILKSNRIKKWRSRGVICDDWDNLYNKYINTTNCEECDIELVEGNYGSNKKCLDHDHGTGVFRNVLCNLCNCRRR